MSRLLLAESIKNLCRKNERFLIELAETILVDPVEERLDESLEEGDVIEPVVEEISEIYTLSEFNEERETTAVDQSEWNQLMELNQKSKDLKKKAFFCSFCFAEFNTLTKCIYHEKAKHQQIHEQEVKRLICDRCGVK